VEEAVGAGAVAVEAAGSAGSEEVAPAEGEPAEIIEDTNDVRFFAVDRGREFGKR
jgi:hypothetical protein